MSKVTLSDDLNSYHSKALIRVKVKEFFSEFSAKIFELADEAGNLDIKKFEAISGINGDFYNEYCSQLKGFFDSSASTFGKKSIKTMYFTYNGKNYMLTQQGITEKAPVSIAPFTGDLPLKESFHDVEKACLKLRFQQE